MNRYFKNWGVMRAVRLVLAIIVVIQGIVAKEYLLVGLGVLFSIMPLMNAGCCGVTGCNTPIRRGDKKTKDIVYEEIR